MTQLITTMPLARYRFNSGDLRADGRARTGLFKPKKGECLSIFDVTGMTADEACKHGHKYADNPQKGRIHKGYAVVPCSVYWELNLSPDYDNDPPRHVSVDIPGADENRREIAKAIAAAVTAVQNC